LKAKLAVTALIGVVLAGCGGGGAKRSPYTAEGLKVKVEQQLVGTRKKIDAAHGHSTIGGLAPRASCTVRTSTTLRCDVIDLNLTPFGAQTVDVTVDPQTGQTRITPRDGSG
jgi:CO/xanthine dehydrogenase Mo-binding subunit